MVALRIFKEIVLMGQRLRWIARVQSCQNVSFALILYSPIFLSHYIISLLKLNAILYDEQAEYIIIIIIFYYFFKRVGGKYD